MGCLFPSVHKGFVCLSEQITNGGKSYSGLVLASISENNVT